MRYMLTCYDVGGLAKLYSVDRKEWTDHSKFWRDDVFGINIVFSFVNLFFFLLIVACGILMLANINLEKVEQNDSNEMS